MLALGFTVFFRLSEPNDRTMSFFRNSVAGAAACAAALVLAGCATTSTPTSAIEDDALAYAQRHFSLAKVRPEVRQALTRRGNADLKFERIELKLTTHYEHVKGRDGNYQTESTMINAGAGFVYEIRRQINNDVPYALQFDTNYAGLVGVKWQVVLLSEPNSRPLRDAVEIKELTPGIAQPQPNREYVFEYRAVTPAIGEDTVARTVCRTGSFYPAAQVHEKLVGRALDLDCGVYHEGHKRGVRKAVYLERYGVVLKAGSSNAYKKETISFDDVTVVR